VSAADSVDKSIDPLPNPSTHGWLNRMRDSPRMETQEETGTAGQPALCHAAVMRAT
jgi:hypothetical protein